VELLVREYSKYLVLYSMIRNFQIHAKEGRAEEILSQRLEFISVPTP